MQGAQKGILKEVGEWILPSGPTSGAGFGDGGNADLFIQAPPDGAHKDVWREYGFGDGGNADLFIQGPPDGAHKDVWREDGFRCVGFAGGMDM